MSPSHPRSHSAKQRSALSELSLDSATESAWVDVVHQMEEVYSDLIKYQVEIEEKNQQLEEAQQFIAGVLTSMTDVLIVCDQQGQILQVNRALEQLIGRSADRLIGQPVLLLFNDRSQQLLMQQPQFLFADCEVQMLGVDADVPLSMNAAPRRDSRGRLLGGVLIGRPIGELRRAYDELNLSHRQLKQAQQQLIDSEKMASLGRLVAGVAHELNNPISFVYGNVHILIRYAQRLSGYLEQLHQQASPELDALRQQLRIDKLLADLPSLLEGTMEGAERVRDIVMDLRQFSSGQKHHDTEFDLVHTIQTAVHWVTRDAGIKIRIGYELPQQQLIKGNPGHIQQVLINLVQNAVDAMAEVEQPRLMLSLKTEEQQLVFSIKDNGSGIDDSQLSQLFEPFFTTKPVGQGTGLGLSLSYGLVREHGGQLLAANRPEGGAVFKMILPLNPVPAVEGQTDSGERV